MRVQINLASRPFVELRPFFLRLRLAMAALALAGLAIAIAAHVFSAKAARQQLELDRLRNQTIAAQQGKLHTEQRMRDPVNARVLDRAHFLNALFLRKSFSWTAVMMDLENVLPNGVQVTSLQPQVTADGNVVIQLRVAGERGNAVQLVRNLERSRRFLQARLVGETSQAKEVANGRAVANANAQGPAPPPGVEFDILADYNPLPPGESYAVGHGRPAAVATHPAAHPAARRGATGNSATSNIGRGYPADGLHLQPYQGSRPAASNPAATFQRPQGATR